MEQISIWSLLAVFITQGIGAYNHWHVMRKAERVSGTFWEYLFRQETNRSAWTFFALCGSAWGFAIGGQADYLNPELFISVIQHGMIDTKLAAAIVGAIGASYMTGYGFDSLINKGDEVQLKGE